MANLTRFKHVYFGPGDDNTPFCPGCYELKGAAVHLIPKSKETHICPVCRFEYTYTEQIYYDYVAESNARFFAKNQ
jgi:hypothetical protein